VLELFLEAIVRNPFQLFRCILYNVCSITRAQPVPLCFRWRKKGKKNQLEPGQESMWDAPVVTLSFAKKSLTKTDLCAGTPRDGESQLLGSSFFGEFPSNRIPKCDE